MDEERKNNLLMDLKYQFHCPKNLCADILIVAYKNTNILEECIFSIKNNTKNHNIKIHLWDNAQTNNHLKNQVDYYYSSEENIGFIIPNNNMTQRCESQYCVYINSDVVVKEGWLECLLGYLHYDEKIAVTGFHGQKLDEQGNGYGRFSGENIDFLSGWSLAMKTDLAKKFGPFDDCLLKFALFEDSDLCLRVKKENFKIRAIEAIFAHHIGGSTFSNLKENKFIKEYTKSNRENFLKKWF